MLNKLNVFPPSDDPMPYHCTGCDKKFKKLSYLSKHRVQHSEKESRAKFPCAQCDKVYTLKESLKMHIFKIHSDSNPRKIKNPCRFCGLGFPSQKETGEHEEVHKNNETPFCCTVCQKVYTNSLTLQKHVREAHTMADLYFVCEACGQKFTAKQNLLEHKQLKHDESFQKLNCPVEDCDYVTVYQSTMKSHMFKHTATKSFICEICGKGYQFIGYSFFVILVMFLMSFVVLMRLILFPI